MKERRHLTKTVLVALFAAILLMACVPAAFASVYDYNINWAVCSGPGEVTVELQANYCSACNPNYYNDPGCTPFSHHSIPPYGTRGMTSGCSDGTYAAVRIKDSSNNVLDTQNLVINPSNWPMAQLVKKNFVFSGIPLTGGSTVIVEADLYCSWCGHYYPNPVTLTVQGSNTATTYTGGTSAAPGAGVTVSGRLEDGNGSPLAGKTLTFTLDGLPDVSAVTDAGGVAATTLTIPSSMAAGTYQMTTRFAGEGDYFPSSDVDDFTVTAQSSLVWNIYNSKMMDRSGQTVITLSDTNGDGKNDKAVVTVNASADYASSIVLDVINTGAAQINISDIKIQNVTGLEVNILELTPIKPNTRRGLGFEFTVLPGAGGGSFEVSL